MRIIFDYSAARGGNILKKRALAVLLALFMLVTILSSCSEEVLSERTYITSVSQISGSRIGVITASVYETYAKNRWPNSPIQYYDDLTGVVSALTANKIDVILLDEPEAIVTCNTIPTLTYLNERLTQDSYAFISSNSNKTLITKVNECISRYENDGTLRECEQIWFNNDGEKKIDYPDENAPNGVIVFATDTTMEPFSYVENGKIVGYDIDIICRICKDLGYGLDIQVCNASTIISGIAAGKYDMAGCGISVTEERRKNMLFSSPTYSGGVVAVVMKQPETEAPGYKTITEIEDKKIAVLNESSQKALVENLFPNAECVLYKDTESQATAVDAGNADAAAVDVMLADSVLLRHPQLKIIGKNLSAEDYGFAFPKNSALREEVNKALKSLENSGKISALAEKWLSGDYENAAAESLNTEDAEETLKFAYVDDMQPCSYTDENGVAQGFCVEIAELAAAELGMKFEAVPVSLADVFVSVSRNEYDMGVSALTITDERKKLVDFSEPFYSGGTVVIVEKSPSEENIDTVSIESVDDLDNNRVGMLSGSAFSSAVREKAPDAEQYFFNSLDAEIKALKSGQIDAFCADEPTARYVAAQNNDLMMLNSLLRRDNYSIALQKNSKLTARVNNVLSEFKNDGTIRDLKAKWIYSTGGDKSLPKLDYSGFADTLTVLCASDMPPMDYIDKDGNPVGFDVELAMRIAYKLNMNVEIRRISFDSLIPTIQRGGADMALSCITSNDARSTTVDLSDIYYCGGAAVITNKPADSTFDVSSLNNSVKRLAAVDGTYAADVLDNEFTKADRYLYLSDVAAYAELTDGKVDAVLNEHVFLKKAVKNMNDVFISGTPVGYVQTCAGVNNRDRELLYSFNKFIDVITVDGTLDDMHRRWMRDDNCIMPTIPTPEKPHSKITVGVAGNCEPYCFTNSGNELTGFEIELIKRFAYYESLDVVIVADDADALVDGCAFGKYDFIFADLHYKSTDAERINFSQSYNNDELAFAVRKAGIIDTLKEMLVKIGVSFQNNFVVENRWQLILKGLLVTMLISVCSALFGTLFGFGLCALRCSKRKLLSKTCYGFIQLIQGTPIVVLLMILYYVIFKDSSLSADVVAVIGFSVSFGVCVAEMLKSGIEAVPVGQTEAAKALGFGKYKAFFRIVLPQATKTVLPVYKGEFISMVKNTSVVGYIAIQDLTKMSDIIRSRTYEAFFPLIITAVIYFAVSMLLASGLKMIELEIDPHHRPRRVRGVVNRK